MNTSTWTHLQMLAGRAGRRSSIYPKGYVGTRASADLPTVTSALNMPLNMLSTPSAGLFPEFQHLELLAGQVCLRRPNHFFASCFLVSLPTSFLQPVLYAPLAALHPHRLKMFMLVHTFMSRVRQLSSCRLVHSHLHAPGTKAL